MKLLRTALVAFVLTLVILMPSAMKLALVALALVGVMTLALVGALFVMVYVAIYRNRQREAVEQPPWPEEIAAADESNVHILRSRNGRL